MDNEVLINEFEAAQAMPVVHVNLEESENNLLIDWESREIKFPEAMTNLGVRYDHRAKKIVFEMDRFVGEEDLAAHTFAVHYYNHDGKTPEDEANGGLHPITNLDVSRPDKILCEWRITNKSTQIPGYLVFALHIFSIVDKAYTYHISTVAAAKPLNNTVVATSHGSNMPPDEIEVYIQKMNELSKEIDSRIADFTSDMGGKMKEMGALVERAESASGKAETARGGIEDIYALSKNIQNEINVTAIKVENNAALAESYTHGGTGKREGEDTDNAQYYMNEAKKLADGTVKQENTTTDADYRVLLSENANDTSSAGPARKTSGLTFNPSTKALKVDGYEVIKTNDKPLGTYTGNGQERTIDIGGVGDFLIVIDRNGFIYLCGYYGSSCVWENEKNGDANGSSNAFIDGTLYLASSTYGSTSFVPSLNASGVTYKYMVL